MAHEPGRHPDKPVRRGQDPSVKATRHDAPGQEHGIPEGAAHHEPTGTPTSDRHWTEVQPNAHEGQDKGRPQGKARSRP